MRRGRWASIPPSSGGATWSRRSASRTGRPPARATSRATTRRSARRGSRRRPSPGHAPPPRARAPGEEPGLEATRFFSPGAEVWSAGAVVAAGRIERETGAVVPERLVWTDDAGTIVNPLLADGPPDGPPPAAGGPGPARGAPAA